MADKGVKTVEGTAEEVSKTAEDVSKMADETVKTVEETPDGLSKAQGGANKGKEPIKEYEVVTYDEFKKRSVVGDGLEGHEMWQHSNLKGKGYAAKRLSTEISKKNPVMSIPHDIHVDVNKQQYILDAVNQNPIDNILSNAKILYDNPVIPNDKVTEQLIKTIKHFEEYGIDNILDSSFDMQMIEAIKRIEYIGDGTDGGYLQKLIEILRQLG